MNITLLVRSKLLSTMETEKLIFRLQGLLMRRCVSELHFMCTLTCMVCLSSSYMYMFGTLCAKTLTRQMLYYAQRHNEK